MKKSILVYLLIMILLLSLAACKQDNQETPVSQVDQLNTAAAQTVEAQRTLIAQVTAIPTELETTATQTQPTPVPIGPTSTPTITPTPTEAILCDQAEFVSETIPDGTVLSPGQAFTKTWTLKNSGTCAWTPNYNVIFFSGNAMNAPASVALSNQTVFPGGQVTITFDLQAPFITGVHRGDFKLRNDGGVLFGIGPRAAPIWVEINVPGNFYDFATNYCSPGVQWTSGAGQLPCPGRYGSDQGWVILVEEPVLENLSVDDEPGLQVHPQMVTDGWIRGTYPEITLTGATVFRTIIGCNGSALCDVQFSLIVRVDGGNEQVLGTWREFQNREFTRIELDLTSLAGRRVQFSLLVEANGIPTDDLALWFAPRIEPP